MNPARDPDLNVSPIWIGHAMLRYRRIFKGPIHSGEVEHRNLNQIGIGNLLGQDIQ